jgi:glucose dehydrogenase
LIVRKWVFVPLVVVAIAAGFAATLIPAQVTSNRILHASSEPQNWLTYGGGYSSERYSLLTSLTRDNVKDLELKWVNHPKYLDKMEASPLVVDGVLYTVQNSEVVALDAVTGRTFWTFHYTVPPESNGYLMVVN